MIAAVTGERARRRAPSIRSIGALMLLMALAGCPQKTYYVGITLKDHCNHSVRATTTYAYSTGSYDRSSPALQGDENENSARGRIGVEQRAVESS